MASIAVQPSIAARTGRRWTVWLVAVFVVAAAVMFGVGALGITVSVAQVIRPRFGLVPGIVLAAVVMAGLGVLIAKMIGM